MISAVYFSMHRNSKPLWLMCVHGNSDIAHIQPVGSKQAKLPIFIGNIIECGVFSSHVSITFFPSFYPPSSSFKSFLLVWLCHTQEPPLVHLWLIPLLLVLITSKAITKKNCKFFPSDNAQVTKLRQALHIG